MEKQVPDTDKVWVRKRFSYAHHGEEEKWLEEMAGKGLELSKAYINGYVFKQCKSEPIHYMIDFISEADKANACVMQRYNQAHEGWTYLCSSLGRDYFRSGTALYTERKHYDIDKFIIDEKATARNALNRRIPPLIGTFVLMAAILVLYRGIFYAIPLGLFIFEMLYLIFCDQKMRRAWYVLGLNRMLRRGGAL